MHKNAILIHLLLLFQLLFFYVLANKEQVVQKNVKLKKNKQQHNSQPPSSVPTKVGEDNIPVIEIKGEGKPMTAAQIRALEEEAEGKPLDIKIKKTWTPKDCKTKAKRLDFVTFHYKGYLEDGKKFDQTYGKEPITLQLGAGMTLPGLDKGLKGVCDNELRKITVPWRLARRKKSKVWKNVPKEEHWISFDVEIFQVDQWTPKLQFEFFDLNHDNVLTASELTKYTEKMRKDFGKVLPNQDVDIVQASKYFVKYFDTNRDQKISVEEYQIKMNEDLAIMDKRITGRSSTSAKNSQKENVRKRDPSGLAWTLDFNNDGFLSREELDMAPDLVEKEPEDAIRFWMQEMESKNISSKKVKTEL